MKHPEISPDELKTLQSIPDFKDRLRRMILAERELLSPAERDERADMITEHALIIDEVRNAKTVALYASRENEPSTEMLMRILNMRGKTVLLPVLGHDLKRGWARFVSLADLSVQLPGRPPEPTSPDLGEDAVLEADVFLLPALAVRKDGARLGHGGGWYDRVLKRKRPDTKTFAIVYDTEIYETDEAFPLETHDVAIDGIVSPSGLWRVSDEDKFAEQFRGR